MYNFFMKIKGIVFILFIISILFGSYIFFSPFTYISKINTIYAKNYSHEKISLIKEGFTEEQVISILGEPLDKYTDDSIHFLYSKPRSSLSDTIGWESIRVTFDKIHTVVGVGSDIFFN